MRDHPIIKGYNFKKFEMIAKADLARLKAMQYADKMGTFMEDCKEAICSFICVIREGSTVFSLHWQQEHYSRTELYL